MKKVVRGVKYVAIVNVDKIMKLDIDWFEGYFTAKTKEEKIKWLETTNLKYTSAHGTFTDRAHEFYGIVAYKLSQLR